MSTANKTAIPDAVATASKASVKVALAYFRTEMPTVFAGRSHALHQIKTARRPMVTAKRLAQSFTKRGIYKGSTVAPTRHTADAVDLSDVHALRVRLFKRRGFNGWPSSDPQLRLINRLERDIADGAIVTKEQFNVAAAEVIAANSGFDVKAHVSASDALIAAGRQDMSPSTSTRPLPRALRITDHHTDQESRRHDDQDRLHDHR